MRTGLRHSSFLLLRDLTVLICDDCSRTIEDTTPASRAWSLKTMLVTRAALVTEGGHSGKMTHPSMRSFLVERGKSNHHFKPPMGTGQNLARVRYSLVLFGLQSRLWIIVGVFHRLGSPLKSSEKLESALCSVAPVSAVLGCINTPRATH